MIKQRQALLRTLRDSPPHRLFSPASPVHWSVDRYPVTCHTDAFTYPQQVGYWFLPVCRTAWGFLNDKSVPYLKKKERKKKMMRFPGKAPSLLIIRFASPLPGPSPISSLELLTSTRRFSPCSIRIWPASLLFKQRGQHSMGLWRKRTKHPPNRAPRRHQEPVFSFFLSVCLSVCPSLFLVWKTPCKKQAASHSSFPEGRKSKFG